MSIECCGRGFHGSGHQHRWPTLCIVSGTRIAGVFAPPALCPSLSALSRPTTDINSSNRK
uniref:MIP19218p n=1 Tax=Drosophila melanogaster TaxID=7227 RepID=D5SHR4_DROME|nr:MIP19218p [Drosophila melanogaster]